MGLGTDDFLTTLRVESHVGLHPDVLLLVLKKHGSLIMQICVTSSVVRIQKIAHGS